MAEAILDKKKTLVVENRQSDVKKLSNTTFYELCTQYWNTHGKHLRMKGPSNMIESWKTGIGNPMLKALTTFQVERYLNGRIFRVYKYPPDYPGLSGRF